MAPLWPLSWQPESSSHAPCPSFYVVILLHKFWNSINIVGFADACFLCADGVKMRDWDKQDDSGDDIPNEGLQDVTDSDSEGGDW